MLDEITPVVLTFDEEANVGRCLEKLRWAKSVVVVDSFSTDRTEAIARSFPNVRFLQREFDSHSSQWNWAIRESGIDSEWILALDADYMLDDRFVGELAALQPSEGTNGYRAQFIYAVFGKPLRASLYPDLVVLFRRGFEEIVQEGHTQVVRVDGHPAMLANPIVHDDRKPLSRWLFNQTRYMRLEADEILRTPWSKLSLTDRIRRLRVVAPFLVTFYLLFGRGLILDGTAGLHYTLQRLAAETVLSIELLSRDLGSKAGKPR